MPEPSLENRVTALTDAVVTLAKKVDARDRSRADAGDKRDNAAVRLDDAVVRAIRDAVADAMRDARDRRDVRHEDDAADDCARDDFGGKDPSTRRDRRRLRDDDAEDPDREGEGEGEEGERGEPESLASDDDRRRDARVRDDRRGHDNRVRADSVEQQCVDIQFRAEPAYLATKGVVAPKPMYGERPRSYMLRLLKPLQRYSGNYKTIKLDNLPADALALADREIRADAQRIGRDANLLAAFEAGDVKGKRWREMETVDPVTRQRFIKFVPPGEIRTRADGTQYSVPEPGWFASDEGFGAWCMPRQKLSRDSLIFELAKEANRRLHGLTPRG